MQIFLLGREPVSCTVKLMDGLKSFKATGGRGSSPRGMVNVCLALTLEN